MTTALTRFDTARRALAEARTVDEIKDVRDRAEAVRLYAKQQGESREMQNDIAEIKLRAERRLGVLYGEMERSKGGRPEKTPASVAAVSEYQQAVKESPSSERTIRKWVRAATIPEETFEQYIATVKAQPDGELTSAGVQRLAKKKKHKVHFSSQSDEHNTPPEIIERVMGVLGFIDLDPCSNEGAYNVPAKKHYIKSDNGLTQEWIGRVYMNPPYGRAISAWVEKLCKEYDEGRTTEAIALVPARTDTRWFRRFRNYPRCFLWGRLSFGDSENSAPFPSMIVYLGADIDGFLCVFSDIGDVYEYLSI